MSVIDRKITQCRRCPRLVKHRERIAREKRRAFQDQVYWGKPLPDFGDTSARLLVVGLAPAAHGANRTGRMFTGDRSGEWLYRALHRAGFANQPESIHRNDGLLLQDAVISAMVRCAPPDNKPTVEETENCRDYFVSSFDRYPVRVILALGGLAWRATCVELRERGWLTGKIPQFGHGAEVALAEDRWLVGSYHPSQQNTFTGRLTELMFDAVFARTNVLLSGPM